jgi:hypothetical protein
MYEHIKSSSRRRGQSSGRAEEIAARTVNKHRREEGRTPSKTTQQGTGNPNRVLEARSRQELLNLARERNVRGRGNMKKKELIKALRG